MDSNIILSLCIPTNGVIEWAIPVIESIYAERSPIGSFEVVVTDNGKSDEFAALMCEYEKKYENLVYKQTEAVQFQNQIEAFKIAKGSLIKFVNHRMKLLPGALNYFLQYARENKEETPVTYFSNGVLRRLPEVITLNTFDEYVRTLSYFSSWSAGTAMWKKDFELMDTDKPFNRYFPHIDMVFFDKTGIKYKIVNKVLMEEIPVDDMKKGKYDLFDAFAYEYIRVLDELRRGRFISDETFKHIKNENKQFLARLYYTYIVRKKPCSYNLDGFDQAIEQYYNKKGIFLKIPVLVLKGMYRKIFVRGLVI